MTGRGKRNLQAAVGARDWLRWFLDAIARDELAAGPSLVAGLEGAIAALDALSRVGGRGAESLSVVRLHPDAVIDCREGLQRLLHAIRRGELTAGSGYVARLEGAIAALDALLGELILN